MGLSPPLPLISYLSPIRSCPPYAFPFLTPFSYKAVAPFTAHFLSIPRAFAPAIRFSLPHSLLIQGCRPLYRSFLIYPPRVRARHTLFPSSLPSHTRLSPLFPLISYLSPNRSRPPCAFPSIPPSHTRLAPLLPFRPFPPVKHLHPPYTFNCHSEQREESIGALPALPYRCRTGQAPPPANAPDSSLGLAASL
jgi:hypothetical protein